MATPGQKARERTWTAYHEAGHAVMAVLLDRKLKQVTIAPKRDARGRVTLLGTTPALYAFSQRQRVQMENYVIITMAGCASQRMHDPRCYRSHHYSVDHAEIVKVVGWLVYSTVGRVADSTEVERSYERLLQAWTKAMLRKNWDCVKALAAELLLRETMSGDDVKALVEECQQRRLSLGLEALHTQSKE